MKIYYTVSVRGNVVSKESVRKHISIMKLFGIVLTEHLGSESESIVDMGKNDKDIYEEDMKMIDQCNIVIADITSPSLGVGFMISKAVQLNKPILCLCFNNQKDFIPKISAMISGCPKVNIMYYSNDGDYKNCISTFIENQNTKKIYLTGPPGSGKSTLGKYLSGKLNIPYFSTGELLRSLDPNSELGKIVNDYMKKGELVPSNIMYNIIIDRLGNSFILDGYPPSFDDLQNLQKANIYPDLVIALTCSDEKAIRRQCYRGERVTDTEDKAITRLNVYHQNIPAVDSLRKYWFSNCPLAIIDVNNDNIDEIHDTTLNLVNNFFSESQLNSYQLVCKDPLKPQRSSRFHFHIDSFSTQSVVNLSKKLLACEPEYNGQLKIYPIRNLCLGPQVKSCSTYNNMMNFHTIDQSSDNLPEAFATGCMGQNMDYTVMRTLLNLAMKSNNKYMIEVEQYLGEWSYNNGIISIDNLYDEKMIDMVVFNEFKEFLNKNIPPFELHFGFDIPKDQYPNMPIDLEKLILDCYNNRFDNGGWFIFNDSNFWKYRSNEFSYLSYGEAKSRLIDQTLKLDSILKSYGINITIGLSLEIVHGIWQF